MDICHYFLLNSNPLHLRQLKEKKNELCFIDFAYEKLLLATTKDYLFHKEHAALWFFVLSLRILIFLKNSVEADVWQLPCLCYSPPLFYLQYLLSAE